MKFDPKIHHRHSIRIPGYDYSQAGAYYITLVTLGRMCLFGEVENEVMKLNRFGQIVRRAWFDLPKHYTNVQLDALCIMPNHVHGIIVLTDNGNKKYPLSEIVRAFKAFSARRINAARHMQRNRVWQRNYFEHIIRNNDDFQAIIGYILDNPLNWDKDEYSL